MIVKMKQFINMLESTINEFLSTIPAENIVNVSFHVYGFENNCDEWVTIFYKTDGSDNAE